MNPNQRKARCTDWNHSLIGLFVCLVVTMGSGWNSSCLAIVTPSNPTTKLHPDQAELKATLSKDSVQVAETFTLQLKIIADEGTQVFFPNLVERLGEFDIIGHRDLFDIPSASSDQRRTWTRILTLECIATGIQSIPSIEVSVVHDEDAQTLRFDSIPIEIISVLEDRAVPTDYRDIKPLIDVEPSKVQPASSSSWIWWALGGTAGTFLFASLLIAVVRRRRSIHPATWARNEFEKLRASITISEVSHQVLVTELVAILRDYLGMHWDESAPVQTTNELVKSAEKNGLTHESIKLLSELLELANQSKFAGLNLTDEELTTAIDQATLIVNQVDRLPVSPNS